MRKAARLEKNGGGADVQEHPGDDPGWCAVVLAAGSPPGSQARGWMQWGGRGQAAVKHSDGELWREGLRAGHAHRSNGCLGHFWSTGPPKSLFTGQRLGIEAGSWDEITLILFFLSHLSKWSLFYFIM